MSEPRARAVARLEVELAACQARLAARTDVVAHLTERLFLLEQRLHELELDRRDAPPPDE